MGAHTHGDFSDGDGCQTLSRDPRAAAGDAQKQTSAARCGRRAHLRVLGDSAVCGKQTRVPRGAKARMSDSDRDISFLDSVGANQRMQSGLNSEN